MNRTLIPHTTATADPFEAGELYCYVAAANGLFLAKRNKAFEAIVPVNPDEFMAAMTKMEKEKRLKRNEEKWSKTLMDAGFLIIPNVIIERQKAIGLDPLDLNILLQIAVHWWEAEKLPFPSKQKIANCIGVDASTVRRHIAKMEKDNLIRRQDRWNPDTGAQRSNWYNFGGLIEAAKPFAEEEIQLRKTEQQKRREKRNR